MSKASLVRSYIPQMLKSVRTVCFFLLRTVRRLAALSQALWSLSSCLMFMSLWSRCSSCSNARAVCSLQTLSSLLRSWLLQLQCSSPNGVPAISHISSPFREILPVPRMLCYLLLDWLPFLKDSGPFGAVCWSPSVRVPFERFAPCSPAPLSSGLLLSVKCSGLFRAFCCSLSNT